MRFHTAWAIYGHRIDQKRGRSNGSFTSTSDVLSRQIWVTRDPIMNNPGTQIAHEMGFRNVLYGTSNFTLPSRVGLVSPSRKQELSLKELGD